LEPAETTLACPSEEDPGTQILKPLQAWERPATNARAGACVVRRLSLGGTASPSSAKHSSALGSATSHGGSASQLDQENLEPLEYFLLDYAGDLPEGLAEKLQSNASLHDDFVQQLSLRNGKLQQNSEKLGRLARGQTAPPGDGGTSLWDLQTAAEGRRRELAANKRVAAEAYEAAMHARLTRTCRSAEDQITSMMHKAEKAEEEFKKIKHMAFLERAQSQREFESIGGDIAQTEQQIGELEDAIRS